ncbi:dTDP-glucose 4,6-dehydratase [Flavobacteriaceae bacterium AU392]|nr:dTDP-glucose 4,6-dehydratase [Flavobacteriaceae bacterium]RKM85785.1 dTDP-glucose 4,6-dehydratase [Flavobacteriaceae bacterium AU392]
MKKTVSILGCGWLGVPLAEFLIQNGYTIKGSTRTEEKLQPLKSKNIHPFLIDLENLSHNISEFLDTDILIIATTCKNNNAFKNLISHIRLSRAEAVIFISSTSVYPMLNRVVTENDKTIDSPLAAIENLFISNTDLSSIIIRFAGLIGPKRNPAWFFRNGKTIKHPQGFVNLIHLTDCIHIIHLIIKKNIKNEILNACTDAHPKRLDFYTEIMKRIGRTTPAIETPEQLKYKIISNKKIKKLLDYEFVYQNLLDIKY